MSSIDLVGGDPGKTTNTSGPTDITTLKDASERLEISRQWTLKGLAPETVQVSRDAAKRSGMKLNAWVSRALEKAANSEEEWSATTNPRSESDAAPDTERDDIQAIRKEILRLRAENESMVKTVNTMNTILLKLCADRI